MALTVQKLANFHPSHCCQSLSYWWHTFGSWSFRRHVAYTFHRPGNEGNDSGTKGECDTPHDHKKAMLMSPNQTSVATVAVTYLILTLHILILIFAFPKLRFEATHRFLGWTVTALVWVQVFDRWSGHHWRSVGGYYNRSSF